VTETIFRFAEPVRIGAVLFLNGIFLSFEGSAPHPQRLRLQMRAKTTEITEVGI